MLNFNEMSDIDFLTRIHGLRGSGYEATQLKQLIFDVVEELYRRGYTFSHHNKRMSGNFGYSVYRNHFREVCIGYNGNTFQMSTKLIEGDKTNA